MGDGDLADVIDPKFIPLIWEFEENNLNFSLIENPSYYDLNWFVDGWMSAYLDGKEPAYQMS